MEHLRGPAVSLWPTLGDPTMLLVQHLATGWSIYMHGDEYKCNQFINVQYINASAESFCRNHLGLRPRVAITPLWKVWRYNTRAGFLPYDTAVVYEMEVVSITRGQRRIAAPRLSLSWKGRLNQWIIGVMTELQQVELTKMVGVEVERCCFRGQPATLPGDGTVPVEKPSITSEATGGVAIRLWGCPSIVVALNQQNLQIVIIMIGKLSVWHKLLMIVFYGSLFVLFKVIAGWVVNDE